MAEQQHFRLILTTAPDVKTAESLAAGLVEAKLAACVNLVPGATSYYRWEGKLHKDPEFLLIIKTRSGLMPDVIGFIKGKHPAKVPEIISLPIMEGEKTYLEFLAANTLFRPASERKLPL